MSEDDAILWEGFPSKEISRKIFLISTILINSIISCIGIITLIFFLNFFLDFLYNSYSIITILIFAAIGILEGLYI